MRWMKPPREERGVSLVIVAIAAVALLGATCLGVDTSNVVYQKGRLQHAADAAAFAIAKDCITNHTDPCKVGGDESTVDEFIAANTNGGGAITSRTVDQDPNDHVTVDITRAADLFFGPAIGIGTVDVTAHAKVKWLYATAGAVPPYAVSVCEWIHSPLNTSVFLDASVNDNHPTDPLDALKLKKNDPQSLVKDLLYKSCTPGAGDNAVPPGVTLDPTTRTIRDGLWFSDGTSNDVCGGGQLQHVTLALNDVRYGASMNTNCSFKFDGLPGQVVLLAIYAPWANPYYGGACANGTAGGSLLGYELAPGDLCPNGASNAKGSVPKYKLKIVGFAPFKIEGTCLAGHDVGDSHDDNNVECGTQGFRGQFVGSAQEFPGATYGSGGTNFGAVKLKLVE